MIKNRDAVRISTRVGSALMFHAGMLSFVFNEWGLTTMAWTAIGWSFVIAFVYTLVFRND